MVEKEQVQYRKTLSNILHVAQENAYLWDKRFDVTTLPLFSVWTCEQDNDSRAYGIARNEKTGKLYFCYEDGKLGDTEIDEGIKVSTESLAKELQSYDIPPEKVKSYFLEKLAVPIRKEELQKAAIEIKVKRRLKQLEQALTE